MKYEDRKRFRPLANELELRIGQTLEERKDFLEGRCLDRERRERD